MYGLISIRKSGLNLNGSSGNEDDNMNFKDIKNSERSDSTNTVIPLLRHKVTM